MIGGGIIQVIGVVVAGVIVVVVIKNYRFFYLLSLKNHF